MFILETFSEIHSLQKTYFKETIKTAPLISFRMENFFLKIPDLKYGSQERNYLFYECSPLLGFIMPKKQERLRSELLSEDKIIYLLVFLT